MADEHVQSGSIRFARGLGKEAKNIANCGVAVELSNGNQSISMCSVNKMIDLYFVARCNLTCCN